LLAQGGSKSFHRLSAFPGGAEPPRVRVRGLRGRDRIVNVAFGGARAVTEKLASGGLEDRDRLSGGPELATDE
jgi:hypothetical protein